MITNLNVNRNDLSFAKLVKDNKFFILPNMYIPFFKLHYQNQTYISANKHLKFSNRKIIKRIKNILLRPMSLPLQRLCRQNCFVSDGTF